MKKSEIYFQKSLAYYQIGATIGAAVGGIIISMGISAIGFSQDLSLASVDIENATDRAGIDKIIQFARDRGNLLIYFGAGVIIGMPAFFVWRIYLEKEKIKSVKVTKYPVLFDEMYDGKDVELSKLGYDTYSVKKIRLTGEPLQYDYSVIKYAEENKMILITRDSEVYGGCVENNIPCIQLGENPSVDEIEKELESLKKSDSKR